MRLNVIFQDFPDSPLVPSQSRIADLRGLISVTEDSVYDDNATDDGNNNANDEDDNWSICNSVYSVGEISEGGEDDALTCKLGAGSQEERDSIAGTELVPDTTEVRKERDDFHDARVDHMVTEA